VRGSSRFLLPDTRRTRCVRESVRGPFTTEGVSDRSQRTLLTGCAGGDSDLQVKTERPATESGGEADFADWSRGAVLAGDGETSEVGSSFG
jgi:hypothetical protein